MIKNLFGLKNFKGERIFKGLKLFESLIFEIKRNVFGFTCELIEQ